MRLLVTKVVMQSLRIQFSEVADPTAAFEHVFTTCDGTTVTINVAADLGGTRTAAELMEEYRLQLVALLQAKTLVRVGVEVNTVSTYLKIYSLGYDPIKKNDEISYLGGLNELSLVPGMVSSALVGSVVSRLL